MTDEGDNTRYGGSRNRVGGYLHYGPCRTMKEMHYQGIDYHALHMEAFRLPCILRQPHLARRGNGYGKAGPLHHPGIILPGKDAVPGSRGEGRLYIQKQQDKQGLPRPGVAGQPVIPHPQPGRANGALLWTL
jgi:hypothetical protein